jgi:hypothetical protein
MARRARIHSRDLQPQIAAPKGLFAAARVQRFDWPMDLPTTPIDELGRKLHVGTTSEIPQVTVTIEAFDVSHNIEAFMTGYTPGTFPVSGASITEIKNVDVIGQIRDTSTKKIVNSLYVKRGIVTGIDYSFGVRDNSSTTYTISSTAKKEFRQPIFYETFTAGSGGSHTLANTPTFLPRTSGYLIDAYRTGTDGSTNYLDEGTDYDVSGTTVNFHSNNMAAGDTVWVTYTAPVDRVFENLDDVAPPAIQGKYVPVRISLNHIPRVQSATMRAAFASEQIDEQGSLGKPVGYEIGIPDVTGDISVLKTDNDLLALLEGVSNTTVENDLGFARTDLSLSIQLLDPKNPSRVIKTYYVPSITITNESDTNQVNQSMNESFSWQSSTGEMIIMSGAGFF